MGLRWSIACVVAGVVGCIPATFECQDAAQCGAGTCERSGYCSFPDGGCKSGRRYGGFAPPGIAGRCVPPEELPPIETGTDAEASPPPPAHWDVGATTAEDGGSAPLDVPSVGDDGGPECPACDGAFCIVAQDCVSGNCIDRTCTRLHSCADLEASAPSGVYAIDDGVIELRACENDLAGGGWTLGLVASDDGINTWTYAERERWTNEFATGDVYLTDHDYKSSAMWRLSFTGLLVVHQPSGWWAYYEDVGDGVSSFAAFLETLDEEYCGADQSFALTDGSAFPDGPPLCDTGLHFNHIELEGGAQTCADPGHLEATYGPHFNMTATGNCPFDDPSLASFGPSAQDKRLEKTGLGFGERLGLNTGEPGSGENHIRLYLR